MVEAIDDAKFLLESLQDDEQSIALVDTINLMLANHVLNGGEK